MFSDRTQAGGLLADRLAIEHLPNAVVLALPRGGVPVAVEVARRLKAPLDLILVRKIGMPGQPEYAAGAVAGSEEGGVVWNARALHAANLAPSDFDRSLAAERAVNAERRALYLGDRAPVDLHGKTAVVVDDGIATGSTMRAALQAVRARGAVKVVLAVPVAPPEALEMLAPLADRLIALETPADFFAVGAYYAHFPQVSDAEVREMLAAAAAPAAS
ncbi:MAG: phosphoribosyltransferase [Paracoccaceae bacterium]|nr:phosphoribosyltransferase [Paracoccaceae bacterium]